jgi:threonine synthase
MLAFRAEGRFELDADRMALLAEHWSGTRIDDATTTAIIGDTYRRDGILVDPHTAVGLGAAARARLDPSAPMVVLATAHPAKFPDAVEAATGVRPELPDRLADLFERPEHLVEVPLDQSIIRSTIESYVR